MENHFKPNETHISFETLLFRSNQKQCKSHKTMETLAYAELEAEYKKGTRYNYFDPFMN